MPIQSIIVKQYEDSLEILGLMPECKIRGSPIPLFHEMFRYKNYIETGLGTKNAPFESVCRLKTSLPYL